MSDDTSQPDETGGLHPEIRRDIEAALEGAGELAPCEAQFSWALGVAVNELFNDVWRNVVDSAPDGSRLVDVRREADRTAHQTLALAIAYLTIHDAEIEECIESLENTDRAEVQAHALWLAEFVQRLR